MKAIRAGVENAMNNCKKELIRAILDLCRRTEIEGVITFTGAIILQNTQPVNRCGILHHFETKTTVCDRILWANDNVEFFMLEMGNHFSHGSAVMTIGELADVYTEMVKVVRKIKKAQ